MKQIHKAVLLTLLLAGLLLLCACDEQSASIVPESASGNALPEVSSTVEPVSTPEPEPTAEPTATPEPEPTAEPTATPEPIPTPPADMPSSETVQSEPVQAAAGGYHLLAGGWQNGGGLYYNGQRMQLEVYTSSDEPLHPMPDLTGEMANGDTLLIPTSWGDAYTLSGDEFAGFTPAGIRIKAPGYTLLPGIEFVNVPGAYFHVYQDGKHLFSFVYQYGGVSDARLVFVSCNGELYSTNLAPERDAALEQAMNDFLSVCTVTDTNEVNTLRIGRSLQLNDNGAMFYTLDAFYDAQTGYGYKGPYFSNMSGPWSSAGSVDTKNSTQPIAEDIYRKGDMILRLSDMISSTQLYILPLYEAESEWVWGLAPQHVRVGLDPEAAVSYTVNGVTWRVIYEPSSQVKLGGAAPAQTAGAAQDGDIRVNGASGSGSIGGLFGWSAYLYCESEPQFAFAVRGDAESMEGAVRQLLANFSLAK